MSDFFEQSLPPPPDISSEFVEQPSALPLNASSLERELEQLDTAYDGIVLPIFYLLRPDLCPEPLLGHLAWALSVDEWDTEWAESTKREVIAASADVHRRKGSIGAVRRALNAAGYGDAEIVERHGWDFYNGAAAHDGSLKYEELDHWAEYRVRLDRPISQRQADQVRKLLEAVAPVRALLKAFDYPEAQNIYNGASQHDSLYTHGVVA